VATIHLQRVTDAVDVVRCEELFDEYVTWVVEQYVIVHGLDFRDDDRSVVHADFRAEYPAILGERGRLVLVAVDGASAAVGALKPLSATESELKRMYVRPPFRGMGLSRRIIDYLIGEARALGYRSIQLDTADFMAAAHALYRSIGFVDRAPYQGEAARRGVQAYARFMMLDLISN
jgi:GNAT superfamily N-acetyltransferase